MATMRPTPERIDEGLCGHAIHRGETKCPVCGRRLTMIEQANALRSFSRQLAGEFDRAMRDALEVISRGNRP